MPLPPQAFKSQDDATAARTLLRIFFLPEFLILENLLRCCRTVASVRLYDRIIRLQIYREVNIFYHHILCVCCAHNVLAAAVVNKLQKVHGLSTALLGVFIITVVVVAVVGIKCWGWFFHYAATFLMPLLVLCWRYLVVVPLGWPTSSSRIVTWFFGMWCEWSYTKVASLN